MKKGKGFTLVELLVVVGIVAILPGLLWPSLSKSRESQRRAACQKNLSQLMLAIRTYAMDYDDYHPTSAESGKEINVKTHYGDLGILYPAYITSLDIFTCPSSGDKMSRRADPSGEHDNKPLLDEEATHVSYAYGYNGRGGKNRPWTQGAPATTRVLADRPAMKELTERSNHGVEGRNVVCADGHVEWVPGKEILLTDPKHPDPVIRRDASWWSERPDKQPQEQKE